MAKAGFLQRFVTNMRVVCFSIKVHGRDPVTSQCKELGKLEQLWENKVVI